MNDSNAQLPGPDGAALNTSAPRAIDATATYWFAMFAASALGTNLGDFWTDDLGLDRWPSFGSLIAITAAAIWLDRAAGRRTEAGYWIAIVALRAAATNLGDFVTHDVALGYVAITLITGAATLAAGWFTRIGAPDSTTPQIDLRYWGAMLIAGVFGTVGGDMMSHTIGLLAAAGLLGLLLVLIIAGRNRIAPASVMAYWCVVLAERCAGTPVGDWLASHRGAGLGLPVAIACTGGLLAAGLITRGLMRPADRSADLRGATLPS